MTSRKRCRGAPVSVTPPSRKSRSALAMSCRSTGFAGSTRSLQRVEVAVERLVLAELGAELGDQRQAAIERLAQRRARHDRIQVRDRTPNAVDLGADALEAAEPVEIGRGHALGGDERAPLLGEQLAHGRLDVLGFDGRELGQRVRCEQRIGGVVGGRFAHGLTLAVGPGAKSIGPAVDQDSSRADRPGAAELLYSQRPESAAPRGSASARVRFAGHRRRQRRARGGPTRRRVRRARGVVRARAARRHLRQRRLRAEEGHVERRRARGRPRSTRRITGSTCAPAATTGRS